MEDGVRPALDVARHLVAAARRLRRRFPGVQSVTVQPRSPASSAFVEVAGAWRDAECGEGYASPEILSRVLEASLSVRDGLSAHERDSVNFDRIEYSWPVLAGLLWSSTEHKGRLRVIDVGGSLGTSFRQNRRFLARVPEVAWAIVEQPHFVAAGRRHFHEPGLSFHETIEDAARIEPTVALLSSSLQYLENPVTTLDSLSKTSASLMILDRTPVHRGEFDLLTIQNIPPSIYEGAYRAWIFSRARLLERLRELDWTVVEEFAAPEPAMTTSAGNDFVWTGMLLIRDVNSQSTTMTTTQPEPDLAQLK